MPGADSILPTISLLIKRYGYRFQHTVFTAGPEDGLGGSVVSSLEAGESNVLRRAQLTDLSSIVQWLQDRGVSSLYLTGVPLEHTVCALAHEAVRLGVAVYIVLDGTAAADVQRASQAREMLMREGVSFVTSQSL